MKKLFIALLLLSNGFLFSQDHSSAVKFGFFSPGATESGFIIGYEGRYVIDEFVRTGWSVDWFRKKYVDQNYVNDINSQYGEGISSTLNELRATTNLHEIPILFNITLEKELEDRFKIYGTGSFGAEFLLIFYRNFLNPDNDELRAAVDFSWRLSAGFAYEIGERSDIFAEFSYHSSEPSWTYEVDDPDLGQKRTFERKFDMSGIIMRLGIRFYH